MTTKRNGRAFRRFPRLPGVAVALVLALLASSCATSRALRDGEREEARQHWDLAVLAYEKALSLDPNDSAARIALSRSRFQAAQAHYERGRFHRSAGQLDLAVAELEVSISLDATNDSALSHPCLGPSMTDHTSTLMPATDSRVPSGSRRCTV